MKLQQAQQHERDLIERMRAIRNSSERHVEHMHLEAERLTDWREHVRSQPILALAAATTLGFLAVQSTTRSDGRPATNGKTSQPATDSAGGRAATRATLASGMMAFAGTMASNLLKQYVSGYVRNQLSGAQHDRGQQTADSTETRDVRSPQRWSS